MLDHASLLRQLAGFLYVSHLVRLGEPVAVTLHQPRQSAAVLLSREVLLRLHLCGLARCCPGCKRSMISCLVDAYRYVRH